MTKKYLFNPFNALYQDDVLLSKRPEIQALNGYAQDLENQIALKDSASHTGELELDFVT